MTPERHRLSAAHEDERIRASREQRATARAIADERALADRRLDPLLQYSVETDGLLEDDTGFAPGCRL